MIIRRCACLAVIFLYFTKKVSAGEAPEEEYVSGHVEDVPIRTHTLQNNANITAAVPVQNMFPYPYNFYYPNPYALYSPQRSPYFHSLQNPAETSVQMYPLNLAGYPYKMMQKFVTGEEVTQNLDSQNPSVSTHTAFHNGLYQPFQVTSSDKSNLKQSLVQQPSQNSFFQSPSYSLGDITETPAVNENSVNIKAHKWPSFASEKPSVTKITHSSAPSNSGIAFEMITQPSGLSLDKETRSLIKDNYSYETIGQVKISNNSQESQFLPMNPSNTGVTRSPEEMHSEMKSGILPNVSNETVKSVSTSVSDCLRNGIESTILSAIANIPEQKFEPVGAIPSNTLLEKQIPTDENVSEVVQITDGLKRKSIDVLHGIASSEATNSGSEENKQPFDTIEDIPNTLVVQISTVHNDKTIETPRVDPSGNVILFPLSNLIQKTKHISSNPPQHHQRYFGYNNSVQNNGNKGNSVLEQHGQKPTLLKNEKNYHIGRRNKILDVASLNSNEEQGGSILKLSTKNEGAKKQNKSPSVRATNRNIIILLPSGQELVIDLGKSRSTNTKGSSGSEDGEVPLRGVAGEQQLTQHTHPVENILSEEVLPRDIGRDEETLLSRAGNNTEDGVFDTRIRGGEAPETPFAALEYPSLEQNVHLSALSNLNSVNDNSVTDYTQDYVRRAKDLQNAHTKHVSYDDTASSVIKDYPQRFSLPIPEDEDLQNNMNPNSHW